VKIGASKGQRKRSMTYPLQTLDRRQRARDTLALAAFDQHLDGGFCATKRAELFVSNFQNVVPGEGTPVLWT